MDISSFTVDQAYPTVYYIPDFISVDEEKTLIEKIYSVPKPKWTQLSARRLQNWGGLPHPKGMVLEALPQWLKVYTKKVEELNVFDGREANHVLVNEYKAGQGILPHLDGPLFYPTITTISLASHTLLDFYRPMSNSADSPQEDGAIESSQGLLSQNWKGNWMQKNATSFESRYMMSLLLHPRSLVIFKEDMYNVYLHGIKETYQDTFSHTTINPDKSKATSIGQTLERSTRISLTIRHVPKVLNFKLGLIR